MQDLIKSRNSSSCALHSASGRKESVETKTSLVVEDIAGTNMDIDDINDKFDDRTEDSENEESEEEGLSDSAREDNTRGDKMSYRKNQGLINSSSNSSRDCQSKNKSNVVNGNQNGNPLRSERKQKKQKNGQWVGLTGDSQQGSVPGDGSTKIVEKKKKTELDGGVVGSEGARKGKRACRGDLKKFFVLPDFHRVQRGFVKPGIKSYLIQSLC